MHTSLLKYFFVLVAISCTGKNKGEVLLGSSDERTLKASDTSSLERRLIAANLVNIQDLEPNIRVELKYSTTDNFMKMDMYGDLSRAYLQPDVARKLVKAYQLLLQHDKGLTLLVYDAVRPRSVQQMMWDTLKLPIAEKTQFISNPKNGSLHNYGAAIDLTLCTLTGETLNMGTSYDHIGELARPDLEQKFLAEGKLTDEQVNNRKLLRKVMLEADFQMIGNEWWHFNSCSREEAKSKYDMIE